MQQIEGNKKTFTAGEALEAYRRVKLNTGSGSVVVYADSGDACIGVTQERAANGDPVVVALKTRGRTFEMVAAEAFSAGATLYASDDGKVQDTSTGVAEGIALEAATADGDVVECIFK